MSACRYPDECACVECEERWRAQAEYDAYMAEQESIAMAEMEAEHYAQMEAEAATDADGVGRDGC